MAFNNILDLVDAILSLFSCIADNQRLDINIALGMICRIIFFLVLIILRDLNNYTWVELIPQFFAWLIFHTYIIYYERQYFVYGESNIAYREKSFKIMDILQLLIGTIYLARNFSSILEMITLIFFSINLFANGCELIYILIIRKNHSNDYTKIGGYKPMYCGFILGASGVITFSIYSNQKYKIKNPYLYYVVVITIYGEIMLLVSSVGFYYSNRFYVTDASNWTKRILGFLYGLNVGFFSIFYGFFTGVASLCYILYGCFFRAIYEKINQKSKNKPKQVPTDTEN